MNHETGLLSLLKAFATKACFTVGLCTTAYWSVAKIHHAMNPPRPAPVSDAGASGLRDKVDSLAAQNDLGSLPTANLSHARRNRIVRQEPAVAPAAPAESPSAAGALAATGSSGEAAASPSPSPGDALVQGQEQNPEYPVADPVYPNPYAYHQAMMEMAREEVAREQGAKSGTGAGSATNPAAQIDPNYGQSGQLIKPASGYGSQVYGGVNLGQSNTGVNVTSNLNAQDKQWLTGAQIKASVPAQQIPVSARKADGSVESLQLWSNRWDLDEGVKPDATFAVRPGSGPYPVQFDLTFSIENRNQGAAAEPVSLSFKPSSSTAKNDVVNGRPVRIYTFTMSELPVRANTSNAETAQGLAVRLVFEIHGGTPTLIEGSFGFSRAGVKTEASPWDPSRQPASANDQLTVDQLPFSMKLEKSQ